MKKIFKIIIIPIIIILFLILQLFIFKNMKNTIRKEYEIHFLEIKEKYTFKCESNLNAEHRADFIMDEEDKNSFQKKYQIQLPDFDMNKNESLIVSYGIPILLVYYYEKNRVDWSYGMPHAEAVFDKSLEKEIIYVYKIENERRIWSFGLP